jgi:hemolysin activation/secretion protein
VQASLASTGLGLRFSTEQQVSGFIELAQPLTRAVATRGDRDARTHAGVAAKF